jgi:hypothetical protein
MRKILSSRDEMIMFALKKIKDRNELQNRNRSKNI